jgi:hypothetical protein
MDNYTLPRTELQALFPQRSWAAIIQKINGLGLVRKNKQWTYEEDEFMRFNYFSVPTHQIAQSLGRTIPSIIQRAIILNLKKSNSVYRNTECNKLLDGSIQSLYWIGFIFADGHISQNNRLKITLSIKDLTHLEQFANYVNSKVWITRFGKYDKCTVSIKDIDNIKLLKESYDIHHRKTYNPPSSIIFDKLTNEQKLALIIGFIDGDGSIRKLSRTSSPYNITIKNHASWLSIHTQFSNFLKEYFDVESSMNPKLMNSGYSQINISHSDIVYGIKTFIDENSIPVLSRKWGIISTRLPRQRNRLSLSQIAEVRTLYNKGLKIHHLSKMFNISFAAIKRIVLNTQFE